MIPRWGHFWQQGYNLNNLGRGQLDEATYQVSKAWVFSFLTRMFLKCVHFTSLCKTSDPRGGVIFDPCAIIWSNFVKVTKLCYIPNIKCIQTRWFVKLALISPLLLPWKQEFYMEFKCLNNFAIGPTTKPFCEVWL